MLEKIKQITSKKYFHLCMMIVMVVTILFILAMVVLKYNVEGETNMPFNITKINIISSQEGINKENSEYKWAFQVNQNNDIFIYFEKNKNYDKQEVIDNILIDNIVVDKEGQKRNINFYKPSSENVNKIFQNTEADKIETLTFTGDMETVLPQLKISNQGGVIAFRYANDKVVDYLSNDEVINHNELLKKSSVQEAELKAKLSFDLTISIQSGKKYKTRISLDMPVEGIVKNGTTSTEITDFNDVIFKRIKN